MDNNEFLAEMERRRAAAEQSKPPVAEPVPVYSPVKTYQVPQVSETGLIGFLIKRRIAKDAQQANMILIGVFIVVVAIIAWVNWPHSAAPSTNTNLLPLPGTPGSSLPPSTQTQ